MKNKKGKSVDSSIATHNESGLAAHEKQYRFLAEQLAEQEIEAHDIVHALSAFQVAIPSWALGTGGTRFGRFPGGGEPRNLEEKIADVGLIHSLTRTAGAVSLPIPWDIPRDAQAIRELAASHGLVFDAVNSNTFQDQAGQGHSYKFGSLCDSKAAVRNRAIDHNIEVIEYGKQLGSKSLTVWLADGACFPGQYNFRKALFHTRDALQQIYRHLPDDWQLFIEYKPYEPNFYSTVIRTGALRTCWHRPAGKRPFASSISATTCPIPTSSRSWPPCSRWASWADFTSTTANTATTTSRWAASSLTSFS